MAYEYRHPRKLSFGDKRVPKYNLGTSPNEYVRIRIAPL
jgi:hypothetical protein